MLFTVVKHTEKHRYKEKQLTVCGSLVIQVCKAFEGQ